MDSGPTYRVGYFVVGMFDVLGQQTTLSEWGDLSRPRSELLPALKATAGRVLTLRRMVSGFLRVFLEQSPSPPALTLSEELRQARKKQLIDVEMNTQWFGDTVMLYSPAHVIDDSAPFKEVWGTIGGAATLMISCLAGGFPIRGALEVGSAVELGKGDIYGPVLAQAHFAESRLAEYPRVLICGGLESLLADSISKADSSPPARLTAQMAEFCRELFFKDEDGRLAVDYLGKTLARRLTHIEPNAYQSGLNFVVSELDRFTRSGNQKLRTRYERLHRYYLSRRSFWI
ncbi:hypothetical protein PHYC_02935 [Phycisphaerales bacterium]|nr:hypothetical protein PHYC_02935 [Phycisphaerales bacterium]